MTRCVSSRWNKMKSPNMKTCATALALTFAAVGVHAGALPDGVQLHGFASQAVITTDHNNFFGNSEGRASLGFTELGANISWRINPSLQLAVQAVSRRAGETGNGSPRLDYATLDYTAFASEDGRYGLYLGKIKNPYGLYNETRDVASTRPGILLPQSIYLDRARNFVLSSPGLGWYAEKSLPVGDLGLQISAIRPDATDKETEAVFLGKDQPGKLKGGTSYIGRLMLERDSGRIKLALTGVSINAYYQPGVPDTLQAGRIGFDSWVLSGQYNAENWVLTSEYAKGRTREKNFGSPFLSGTTTGSGYYLQGEYHLTRKWTALTRYDVTYLDNADRDGQVFHSITGLPAHMRFAKDWSAGLTYNASHDWMLRGEFHRVDCTAWLPYSDNTNPQATAQRWNMWLLQAAFRF